MHIDVLVVVEGEICDGKRVTDLFLDWRRRICLKERIENEHSDRVVSEKYSAGQYKEDQEISGYTYILE